MAAAMLIRAASQIRHRLNYQQQSRRLCVDLFNRRLICSSTEHFDTTDEDDDSSSVNVVTAKDPPKIPVWPDPDYHKWELKEAEILRDVEPVVSRAKEILHSDRYLDGERLTADDEKFVVEKLLAHHPNCEDKIGCGLDSIMVDRPSRFRYVRCFFVVRTDGGWIDFSYNKCLQQYISDRYPSYADRYINKHFRRRKIP